MTTDKVSLSTGKSLALDSRQQTALTDFLVRLVQTKSLSTAEGPLSVVIKDELASIGVGDVQVDSIGNVVARLGTGEGPTLLYNAHMDTVQATDEAWEHAPLAAEVEDGVLYGLGACDMKGSLAAMVYAVQSLLQTGTPLNGQLVLAFVVQEETCEGLAMHSLDEELNLNPDWVLLGEPTDMHMSLGQRGRVMLKVTVRGRSSHAARPDLGQNAITAAARLIFGIELLSSEMLNDPLLGPGSVAVTHIESHEVSLNAIPDRCTFYVDRRLTLGETPNMALSQMERVIVTENTDADVEITEYRARSYTGQQCEGRESFNAWAIEAQHPLVTALKDAAGQVLGKQPKSIYWQFSTDGVYTMSEANIPSIGFGPGNPDHAHTVNDHVRLDDVSRAAHVYALLAASLLSA